MHEKQCRTVGRNIFLFYVRIFVGSFTSKRIGLCYYDVVAVLKKKNHICVRISMMPRSHWIQTSNT